LTTLVQPVEEMSATAWKFLMKRLEEPDLKRQSLILKPKLVIRESSARKVSLAGDVVVKPLFST